MSHLIKTPQQWGQPSHRVCNHCGTEFPLDGDHFTIDRRRYPWNPSYFSPWCKPCQVVRVKAWRDKNRERHNERRREYRRIDKANRKNASYQFLPQYVAAAEATKAAAARKRLLKATLRHLNTSRPDYESPKCLYGRWKGMTMAERWQVMKAERAAGIAAATTEPETYIPDAEEIDYAAQLRRLVAENQRKYGTTPKPAAPPFGVLAKPRD